MNTVKSSNREVIDAVRVNPCEIEKDSKKGDLQTRKVSVSSNCKNWFLASKGQVAKITKCVLIIIAIIAAIVATAVGMDVGLS